MRGNYRIPLGWLVIACAGLSASLSLAAQQPAAGHYSAVGEASGNITLTIRLEPRGNNQQVTGSIQYANMKAPRPVTGTYFARTKRLAAKYRLTPTSPEDLPIDGTWNPETNSFDLKVMVLLSVGGGQVPITLKSSLPSTAVDLVFCIDGTSSMVDDMAAVQASTRKTMDDLRNLSADLRVRLVVFTDHTETQVVRQWDFTTDTTEMQRQVDLIKPTGGGDIPEAVHTGLLAAINGNWRPGVRKLIVLIGDAPPSSKDPVTGDQVAKRALEVDPADIYAIAVANNGVVDPEALSAFTEIARRNRGAIFTTKNAAELPAAITGAVGVALGQPATAAGNLGRLVVARDVVDGAPVGVADSFTNLSQVYGWVSYENMPENTELVISWLGGGLNSTSKLTISRSGAAWFWWSTNRVGGFPAGDYSVTLKRGDQVLGRKKFAIR